MSNVLLTPQLITKLTLMDLGDNLLVCRNMSKAYTEKFGQQAGKIGASYDVRRPQRFEVTEDTLTYTSSALNDTKVTLTVNKLAQVSFEFDSKERTLSIEDVRNRYTKKAALAMANKINANAAKFIALNTFNHVGTPGAAPTTYSTYLAAEDLLIAQGVPANEPLTAIINRRMSSAFVGATVGQFNPTDLISGQIRSGRVQNQLGYEWEIDQTIYTHVTGAQGGTPLVSAVPTVTPDGNNSIGTIVLKGFTASTLVAKQGDVIHFATGTDTINSVHPQTRVDDSYPQQYVLQADLTSDGSGNATATVFPGFAPSGQLQNITRLPAINDSVVFFGGTAGQYANKKSPQGLLLHRDAFAFLSVPLEDPEPNGVEMVAQETDPQTGLTISFIRYFDGNARVHKNRLDCLYGFGRLYSELACRISA